MCIGVVRYDGQKSAQSIQEELQKTEDKYLKENFYIRDSVANLKDAIIKTSVNTIIHLSLGTWGQCSNVCVLAQVMDELRFVDNHIILIGKVVFIIHAYINTIILDTCIGISTYYYFTILFL